MKSRDSIAPCSSNALYFHKYRRSFRFHIYLSNLSNQSKIGRDDIFQRKIYHHDIQCNDNAVCIQ